MSEQFEVFGLKDSQFPEKYLNRYNGELLIVGSGRCAWNDLAIIGDHGRHIMTINDMTMHCPYDVKHAYSNDQEWLGKWADARRPDYNNGILKHCCNPGHIFWPFPGHGTSSLNAVYVGLAMGYSRIILAGVPLDNSGHYFDPPWKKTNFEKEVPEKDGLRWWKTSAETIFKGRVKSLSGRTRDLLGGI